MNHPSAILFDKEHVKRIEFDFRLPPSSIGVRRTRPSSKVVMRALKAQKRSRKQGSKDDMDTVTNLDRSIRNTSPLKQPESGRCNEQGEEEQDHNGNNMDSTKVCIDVTHNTDRVLKNVPSNSNVASNDFLEILCSSNEELLQVQEEIDEMTCADRAAYKNLPAFLTAPMVQQAQLQGLIGTLSFSPGRSCSNYNTHLDDAMAQVWANAIQESMQEAETVRNNENMRPMAYRLVPEPWKRLRDACTLRGEEVTSEPQSCPDCSNLNESSSKMLQQHDEKSVIFTESIYSGSNELHLAHCVFYDCLYNQFPKLSMSCGAKFGCDYLLYDGNRKERHAFAGVRILPCKTLHRSGEPLELPLPTAYDLHGFVRGLNTAGKLALLATVVRRNDDDSFFSVTVVDLALEKILSAPVHLKKQTKDSTTHNELRRNVGEHLGK